MLGECGVLGDSVDVVYAATSDSDSWIEREVLLLRADGCPKVWVATSDSFHQQAAHGSGAYVWNCKTLISEVLSSHVAFFVSSLVPVC
jgi:predicted RNA-binding protein with PIN domain